MKTLFLIFIPLLFVSCKFDHRIEALSEMAKRHPDIYKQDDIEGFKLVRQIYTPGDSITESLYDNKNGDEEIVVLSNQKAEAYAIPFPTNDNRKYWAFFGDSINKPGNNTFSGELKNAVKAISIKNNKLADGVLQDVFTSLLQLIPVRGNDTAMIKRYTNPVNFGDSCNNLRNNNYKSILKTAKISGTRWWECNGYVDIQGDRIYQVTNSRKLKTGVFYLDVYVFQQPCIIYVKPLIM